MWSTDRRSPTAAHADRKRRPKWVLGVGGYTCPGGYKYGGLALQFRVWATGRQPVIVKKLTVKKPKLWLTTVRLSGINLGSGKGLMR